MPNKEHLAKLLEGVETWNQWRAENPDIVPDLIGIKLYGADLSVAAIIKHNFDWSGFEENCFDKEHYISAFLFYRNLAGPVPFRVNFCGVDFSDADLRNTDFRWADLFKANLEGANLCGANLGAANLVEANFSKSNLSRANLSGGGGSPLGAGGPNEIYIDWNSLRQRFGVSLADQIRLIWNANRKRAEEDRDYGNNFRETSFCNAVLENADLEGADLVSVNLIGADLRNANLRRANLSKKVLSNVKIDNANLSMANLSGVDLSKRDLRKMDFSNAILEGANLSESYLGGANLREAKCHKAIFQKANMRGVDLGDADLTEANFRASDFSHSFVMSEKDFGRAYLGGADLRKVDLRRAKLIETILIESNLSGAGTDIRGANLSGSDVSWADLSLANLSGAILYSTNFHGAKLYGANLESAELRWAHLGRTDFSCANLSGADLTGATFISTKLNDANLDNCCVYGISAWNVSRNKKTSQKNLVITEEDEPIVTVDDFEVAQFIYILLKNKKIKQIIDTITSRAVLILGRFNDRCKPILDVMHTHLRDIYGLVPILFDWEPSEKRDLTETIVTLAGMARFIVADLTDAKSIPQELSHIIPTFQSVPIQPIILASQIEYTMFKHWENFNNVLPVFEYNDQVHLVEHLKSDVIAPVEGWEKSDDKEAAKKREMAEQLKRAKAENAKKDAQIAQFKAQLEALK